MKQVINVLMILLSIVTATSLDKQPIKRSYVCPPNFIRLSHRCYFFSKEKATWQDAYYQCHSMHSNLAIIKNSNQDKLIRKTLSRKSLDPLERWLGGRFDWQQRQWKWAASGKPLSYKGFDKSVNQDEENLQWNCIIMDPKMEYRWNARSCLQERHFICHKKIQTVSNQKLRKKLMQQYNTNSLNEIPIPDSPKGSQQNSGDLKFHQQIQNRNVQSALVSDPFHIEILPLSLNAQPAYRKKEKKLKKKRKNYPVPALRQFANGTVYENTAPSIVLNDQSYRRRRNRVKETENNKNDLRLSYRTYKESSPKRHPMYPNPIVEEYNLKNR